MVLVPYSIGPEDSPGKIILASQCLKRAQPEVKTKQNPKANAFLKENNDFSFQNYLSRADHPFKFCTVLQDLAVILKQLNPSRGTRAHLPGSHLRLLSSVTETHLPSRRRSLAVKLCSLLRVAFS